MYITSFQKKKTCLGAKYVLTYAHTELSRFDDPRWLEQGQSGQRHQHNALILAEEKKKQSAFLDEQNILW